MTHPSQPTAAPSEATPGARTQELPAVPPPPASTGTAEMHNPATFIPGFADPQPAVRPPLVEPTSRRRWSYGPRLRAIVAGVALLVLALLLLTWGLSVGREPLWSASTLWSAFATVCTLSVFAAFVPDAPGRTRLQPRPGGRIALGGLAGLAVFWVFVALPQAATDRGFLLTAAFAAAVGALWTSPNRPGSTAGT